MGGLGILCLHEDIYLNRIEGCTLGASVLALMLASLAVALEWFKNEDAQ